ncbi:hypothetical protein HZH68_016188 [Vespula germanica]|uniref:Uncharacterized protein n=1 Tax=Vespula germanica TaxID=30212 RepID=A0A834J3J1_VESGE|nr:hypothetical protein HZH68_016188 [Vespula germanica]
MDTEYRYTRFKPNKCSKNCDSDTKMMGAVWAKFYNKFSTDGKVRHDNYFKETESSCSWQRAEVAGTILYFEDKTASRR